MERYPGGGGLRRQPRGDRRLTMEPAGRVRQKIAGPEAGCPPIDGRTCKLTTNCAKPALRSLRGCQRPVRALFHDAVRLRAARHGPALVKAQPGVTGIGIARTLVLA